MKAFAALTAAPDTADDAPFWRRKAMKDMTATEWESLCDGCGRCCLNKLQEEGSDRTYYTDVGCRLLDAQTCRYKLVAAGKDLYWWHPLVSGDPETVHQAGVSVRGKVGASEVDVKDK